MTFDWSCALSLAGIRTEMDFSGKSLKALMKRADRVGAAHVMIVGSQEMEDGAVVVRNMQTKEQTNIPINGIVGHIQNYLAAE
ncbi:MAG: His/Gly/Thr/Pro-type tRNA ligase C-terminal domain-containing protein [Desulfobacterales bacterium]